MLDSICTVSSEKPLLSIVIVPDSTAHATGNALRDAMKQSLRELEIVVVDDGHLSDIPAPTLHQLAGADPRVRIVSLHENDAPSAPLRAGIEAATGLYLYLADNETRLRPEAAASWVDSARSTGADLLLLSFTTGQPDAATPADGFPLDKDAYHREEYMRLIYSRGYHFELWAHLIKRSLTERDLIYPRTLQTGIDAYLLTQLLHFARAIRADRGPTLLHRTRLDRITPAQTLTDRQAIDLLEYPDDIDRYLRGKTEYPAVDSALAQHQLAMLQLAVSGAYKRVIDRAAERAVRLYHRFPELMRIKKCRRFNLLFRLYLFSPALASFVALGYKIRRRISWDHPLEYERSEHPNRTED